MSKYKIILIVIFAFVLITLPSFSQDNTDLKGKVFYKDSSEPVVGANIFCKENLNGQSTNKDGSFHLKNLKKGQTIVVSFIGCKELSFIYQGESYKKINIECGDIALQEVVAVGYGTQERRDLTGAVATIKSEDIKGLSTSFDNALAGKIAGVNINLSSGVPGSATAITIRGLSTLQGDKNNPLIVIDGVPVYGSGKNLNNINFSNGTASFVTIGGSSVQGGYSNREEFERNPLASLNPEDIESIEILKDAFSTAIYGSRGAAGVILITTKKGKKGIPNIQIAHSMQLSRPIGLPELLNSKEYSKIYDVVKKIQYPTVYNTNWLDQIIRTGVSNEDYISISGGGDKNSYFISLNRLNQEAYIINQNLERYSARTNIRFKPAKWINFGTYTSLSILNNNALNSQQIYRTAVLLPPNLPIKDEQGEYFYHNGNVGHANNINLGIGNKENPVAMSTYDNHVDDKRVISKFFGEVIPFSWLSFKSEIGIDLYNSFAYTRNPDKPTTINGSATESNSQNLKITINNLAIVRKFITKKSLLNLTVGQSFEKSIERMITIGADNFYDNDVKSLKGAKRSRLLLDRQNRWAIVSYFARLNYRFKDRYMFGATYRIDGSSKFAFNQRYRGFPSFSAGWIISEEEFLKTASWINNLKIRASYGLTGLAGTLGYYSSQGTWTLNKDNGGLNYSGVPLLYMDQIPNPNLDWETTWSLDLGADAQLFNNKVDVTIDYFYKKINNLLGNDFLPSYVGFTQQQQNIGSMQNQGIELTLNYKAIDTKKWFWMTSFNISHMKDKVIKITKAGYQMSGYKVIKEGQSMNTFYLYDWSKVNPDTGKSMWRLADGSVTENPPTFSSTNIENKFLAGSSIPLFYGGWSNNLKYRSIELKSSISFAYGQKMMNGTSATLQTYHLSDSYNLSTKILDYWKIPGHKTSIPKLNEDNKYGYEVSRLSDRFLEDASYIRLKDITVSYYMSNSFLDKLYIKRIKFYLQASNILTISNYSGIDPEVNAFGSNALQGGYDEITMPQAKSLRLGINLTF